jgi:hypothetical protein
LAKTLGRSCRQTRIWLYCPFPGEGKASQKTEKRPVEAGFDLQILFSNLHFLISAAALSEGLALEREVLAKVFASEDAAEGMKAYLEKRIAKFKCRQRSVIEDCPWALLQVARAGSPTHPSDLQSAC